METTMIRTQYAAGLGAIACLLSSTTAFAADATRSSSALPVAAPAAAAQHAPTQGIRAATPLEKKSKAIGRNTAIVLGILGGVAVGTTIYVIADDDDDEPDSPG
jgi:hypothetical protein